MLIITLNGIKSYEEITWLILYQLIILGGDDRKVLIWKLCEAVAGNTKPRCLRQKHHSNIFCVTFDHDNKHIVTAGKYI